MVEWEEEGEAPGRLRHKVSLVGAKPPNNFLYLTLNPAKEGEATCHTVSHEDILTPAFVSCRLAQGKAWYFHIGGLPVLFQMSTVREKHCMDLKWLRTRV